MITHNFNTLDLLTSPVWIVSPFEEQLIYANSAARLLMQDLTFSQLRTGPYSVSSQKELPKYLSDLQNQHDIIEILTVQRKEEETALSCRLVLRELTETEPVIIFEGIEAPATLGLKASRSANYQRKKQGFYARFFLTNSAPMLLIDPSRDGQIVDANLAALNFYGYNHETMCQKHTWEINMLGRRVMPIMHEISHLPGGHKPLNLFINWRMDLLVMCRPMPGRLKFMATSSCYVLCMILLSKNGWRSSWNMLLTMTR
ncbi:Sensory box-containing diguanylate cyclase [Escherichia coli]|nr:Sensory box-containing diguanylate cyclase [Escherichia coli]